MQNQEAATGNFEWNKLPSGRRVIHDFTPCTWGSRLYEVSGKRYTPSFLQGHPSSLRFGHPDVTTGDTAFLTLGHGLGAPCPSSAPAGNPSSLRFGHPDVASGRDSYARGSLNRCEAHPVLARQLLIRLHKPACTRTRRTIDAHTLITHRLKQAQQLRGHIGCRK